MTGTERKRRWREQNPEASKAYESKRALARRNGFWASEEGTRPCKSSDSYYSYENRWMTARYITKRETGSSRAPEVSETALGSPAFRRRWRSTESDRQILRSGKQSILSSLYPPILPGR